MTTLYIFEIVGKYRRILSRLQIQVAGSVVARLMWKGEHAGWYVTHDVARDVETAPHYHICRKL